jgi:hypothetical protein
MAQKEKLKNLTLAELDKQNKALDEQRDFTVVIGGTKYKLAHDVIFRNSKKAKVLDDMVKFFQEASKNIDILELATPYTALLVMKHFTTLDVSDDILEAISLLETLVDLNVLNNIIAELPEDQMEEVFELITKTVTNMADSLEEVEAEAKRLSEVVENEAVKELIPDVNGK